MADTKNRILDVAEKLTQINGFNGFSYIDLADEIGVKTARNRSFVCVGCCQRKCSPSARLCGSA